MKRPGIFLLKKILFLHPAEEYVLILAKVNVTGTYKDGAVGINNLERFVGDYALEKDSNLNELPDETFPQKVAVIGAGPAGLSCAYQLALKGYGVTVYRSIQQSGRHA